MWGFVSAVPFVELSASPTALKAFKDRHFDIPQTPDRIRAHHLMFSQWYSDLWPSWREKPVRAGYINSLSYPVL